MDRGRIVLDDNAWATSPSSRGSRTRPVAHSWESFEE